MLEMQFNLVYGMYTIHPNWQPALTLLVGQVYFLNKTFHLFQFEYINM